VTLRIYLFVLLSYLGWLKVEGVETREGSKRSPLTRIARRMRGRLLATANRAIPTYASLELNDPAREPVRSSMSARRDSALRVVVPGPLAESTGSQRDDDLASCQPRLSGEVGLFERFYSLAVASQYLSDFVKARQQRILAGGVEVKRITLSALANDPLLREVDRHGCRFVRF
jgi:hypothetical protein